MDPLYNEVHASSASSYCQLKIPYSPFFVWATTGIEIHLTYFPGGHELWICLSLSPPYSWLMNSRGLSIWPQPLVCWSEEGMVFTKDFSLTFPGETDQTQRTTSVRELQSYQRYNHQSILNSNPWRPTAPGGPPDLRPLSTCWGNYRLWHETNTSATSDLGLLISKGR